jgi:hypothetical protein
MGVSSWGQHIICNTPKIPIRDIQLPPRCSLITVLIKGGENPMDEATKRAIEWFSHYHNSLKEGEKLGSQEVKHVYRIDDDTPAEVWYNDTMVLEPWNPSEADVQMLQGCNIDWL